MTSTKIGLVIIFVNNYDATSYMYPLIGLTDCLSLCCCEWLPGDSEATSSQHTAEG